MHIIIKTIPIAGASMNIIPAGMSERCVPVPDISLFRVYGGDWAM
jgi:hypothetical protein